MHVPAPSPAHTAMFARQVPPEQQPPAPHVLSAQQGSPVPPHARQNPPVQVVPDAVQT
jgi:hypothetical protein